MCGTGLKTAPRPALKTRDLGKRKGNPIVIFAISAYGVAAFYVKDMPATPDGSSPEPPPMAPPAAEPPPL